MSCTPLRRATRLLTLGALLGLAHAQQFTPEENLLAPLRLQLDGPADVVLSRDTGERILEIVTTRDMPLPTVARRYGLTAGAVKLVSSQGNSQVVRLRLPGRVQARQPLRPASVLTYRVRPGDTLAGVAGRFGLTVMDLLGANLDRTSLDRLKVDTTLNVPTGARGLLVRIKPGQSALSLIAGYGADLVATARANQVLPTELDVGDELLLPGIRAEGFAQQLAERRENERQAAIAAQRQAQYEKFVAWKKGRERDRLEAKYAAQAQYEKFLAWKDSPERKAAMAALERQQQFEAAQAAQARSRQVAQRSSVTAAGLAPGRSGLAWPMRNFRLTSRYAEQDIDFHRQVFHGGIDLAAPYGTPIYAAAAGRVTQSGFGAYGLNVFTQSGNSTLVYGHMSRTAVSAGQSVDQGQLLGYIGCTGICTGPHLHFEVRLGGQTVDPLGLLP